MNSWFAVGYQHSVVVFGSHSKLLIQGSSTEDKFNT